MSGRQTTPAEVARDIVTGVLLDGFGEHDPPEVPDEIIQRLHQVAVAAARGLWPEEASIEQHLVKRDEHAMNGPTFFRFPESALDQPAAQVIEVNFGANVRVKGIADALPDRDIDELPAEEVIALLKNLGWPAEEAFAITLQSRLRDFSLPRDAEPYAEMLVYLLKQLHHLSHRVAEGHERRGVDPVVRLQEVIAIYLAFFLVWPAANDLGRAPRHEMEVIGLRPELQKQLDYSIDQLGNLLVTQLVAVFTENAGVRAALRTLAPVPPVRLLDQVAELRDEVLVMVLRGLDGSSASRYRTQYGVGALARYSGRLDSAQSILNEASRIARAIILDAGGRLGRSSLRIDGYNGW